MKLLTFFVAACAAGVLALHAADPGPAQKVDREAAAAFIKKCFRDRTPSSCDAPAAARLQH